LATMVGAGVASAWGLGACGRSRYVSVLAPPSSLRPAILGLFERKTGIQVRPSAWVSPTDAFAKVLSEGARTDLVVGIVDLFTPLVQEAVSRGLVLPLDQSKLPKAPELSEAFRADMCFVGGRLYMMPLYWGYTSVLYNRAAISPSDPLIDSWGLLFDDRFKGRVALRDDAHESIAAAALYLGHRQPLTMDRAEVNSVKAFLISKKSNFRALWSNFAEAIQLMATGEVSAIYGQPVLAQELVTQGIGVEKNLPKEGLLMFVQGALIPQGALHPGYANEWLQFLLSDDIGAKLTQEAAVLSPLESVRRQFEPTSRAASFGYEALSAGTPLIRLGRPQHLDAWIEAWAEFKAA
jgi:spermidine/putrescine transport system substrate-binding protein